jgi:hypothetical protein
MTSSGQSTVSFTSASMSYPRSGHELGWSRWLIGLQGSAGGYSAKGSMGYVMVMEVLERRGLD